MTLTRGWAIPLPNENNLTECRNVTVILRLVLDKSGRLIHGELVDVAGTLRERFVGWRGLIRAVRAWLTQQERDSPSESHRE